jgi:hypothetical protein
MMVDSMHYSSDKLAGKKPPKNKSGPGSVNKLVFAVQCFSVFHLHESTSLKPLIQRGGGVNFFKLCDIGDLAAIVEAQV